MCHSKLVHYSRGRNTVKYSKQFQYCASQVCLSKENSTDFTHRSQCTGEGEDTACEQSCSKLFGAPDGAALSLPHVMSLKAAPVEAEDCEVG